jgi:hypothetical protein
MDLAIDKDTGDLLIRELDMRLTQGTDSVEQRLRQNLKAYQGDWFLDESNGLPYYKDILVKNPDISNIESIFKVAIAETEGVDELLAFDSSFDSSIRQFSISFKVRSGEDVISLDESLF